MSVQSYRFWGLLIVLASTTMPWSVRSVPQVVLHSDDRSGFSEDVVSCVGCNPLIFGQPLNINRASIQHLISLPYIGEKRAMEIVSHRNQFGDFQKVADLDQVRGIGPKTLERLQPYIVTE